MNPLEAYLEELLDTRSTGAAVATSVVPLVILFGFMQKYLAKERASISAQ